jgi:iron complex outermembrane receptor protein
MKVLVTAEAGRIFVAFFYARFLNCPAWIANARMTWMDRYLERKWMMRANRRWVVALTALCLMVPHPAEAEQEPTGVLRMDDIVVTATKTEKRIADAPGSITVIDREELQKKDIQTVDDALNSLPAVFVKRIEVIRGAASALYGGNAMGGVINIITQTPQHLEALASGGYGTNNTWRYGLSAGDRFGDRLSVRLGYEAESTDGYVTTPVVGTITSGSGNVSGGYAMDDKYGDPTRWLVGDKGENGAERSNLN